MSPIARDRKTGKLRFGPRFWIIVAALGVLLAGYGIAHRADTRIDSSYQTLLDRCNDANPGRAIQWYLVGKQPMTPKLARLRSDLEATPGFNKTSGRVDCSVAVTKP